MTRPAPARPACAAVLGDLVADVVLLPGRPLRRGTDVEGRVLVRQGGSAATTARVLAAAGVRTSLVTAIGPDLAGASLAAYLGACGVEVRAVRVGVPTGRLGVIVEASGERTFVADRGAILRLRSRHLRAAWFEGLDLLHLPGYSLVGDGLAATSRRAVAIARRAGAAVSVDLSSAGFMEDLGAGEMLARVREIGPDVLFANEAEWDAAADAGLLGRLAPLVVLKQGARGACALGRALAQGGRSSTEPVFVAAPRSPVADSTGAGDAFDAGFLASWLASGAAAAGGVAGGGGAVGPRRAVERAIRAGHRAARRELGGPRLELELGELRPRSSRQRG